MSGTDLFIYFEFVVTISLSCFFIYVFKNVLCMISIQKLGINKTKPIYKDMKVTANPLYKRGISLFYEFIVNVIMNTFCLMSVL